MKNKLFPIFITSLGLLTAYVFYALWHSETLTPSTTPLEKEQVIVEDLSNKQVVPKVNYKNVSASTLKINKQETIIFKTAEESAKEAEKVYESLRPEDHEELMEEANSAFDRLDKHIEKMNQEEVNAKYLKEENLPIE